MGDISKEYIRDLIGTNARILEIGCFNGKDSVELAEICDSEVHCFEPNPITFQGLKDLKHDLLILWNYAVCAHNGTTILNLSSNHPQSDTIKEPKLHKKIFKDVKFKKQITVKATTLDAWNHSVREREGLDFIWCDVNGAEADVIIGGSYTLAKTKYLYIEYCEKELFAKAMNRKQMIHALPGFEVIGDYNFQGNYGNLLFKNKNI